MIQYTGLIILAAWAVNVWAFLIVLEAKPGFARTILWGAILLIPFVGWLVWFLFGPRPAAS